MANKHNAYCVMRWRKTNGLEADFDLLPNTSLTDLGQQVLRDNPLAINANVFFVENLTTAQLAQLRSDSKVVVLAVDTFDDTDPKKDVKNTDKNDKPNSGALNALKNEFKSKFAGFTDAELDEVRNGRSLKEIIDGLRGRWK